ncbi:MAG: hypothetical protein HY226_01215 [Candidatus Vogelbacteria bacterium]|nr:hypothetical protein [Candidatus Vogelbacteria bacterium]
MLWTTLPPIYQENLLEEMVSDPLVDIVRYNTGINHDIPAEEILATIAKLTKKYKKEFWIDLKGRQLRIIEWSVPPYGPIVLNHNIKATLPAKVYFRGDKPSQLKQIVNGNQIYVDPPPEFAVGTGQSVNIVGGDARITDEYFLKKDLEFISAAAKLKLNRFLFSFTELESDLKLFFAAMSEIRNPMAVLKLESARGLELMRSIQSTRKTRYMTARDDLVIHVGPIEATKAAKEIVQKDPEAVCASRLLLGLETGGEVTLADVSDLELMRSFGYKHFMLSDGISQRHFKKVMEFWVDYKKYIS